jgi:hypothetical protein
MKTALPTCVALDIALSHDNPLTPLASLAVVGYAVVTAMPSLVHPASSMPHPCDAEVRYETFNIKSDHTATGLFVRLPDRLIKPFLDMSPAAVTMGGRH